jgi:hypothetical protein
MRWYALRQWSQRQIRFGLRSWVLEELYGAVVPPYDGYRYAHIRARRSIDSEVRLGDRRSKPQADFAADLNYFLRTVDILAERLQSRGNHLALVIAPDFGSLHGNELQTERARYVSALQAWASRRGATFLDWNSTIRWESTDSIDGVHATPAGREKWSAALVGWLAQRSPPY